MRLSIPASLAALLLAFGAQAQPQTLETGLADVQSGWATANYQTPAGDPRVAAFDALSRRADALVTAYPGRAEPLIWQGIVLSTYAGAKGGLGALSLAKQSRAALQAAMKIDPDALQGSAYTSLGTLYYKVPGFPLGFGDKKKARQYLEHALALNPDGIDPNYFYGELLFDQHEYAAALEHLQKALNAPARPGREIADEGRRQEIRELLSKVQTRVARAD
jgi:tetratricopeptide (TPR) repeat protein